jgi:hypothetical protein
MVHGTRASVLRPRIGGIGSIEGDIISFIVSILP